MNTVAYWDNAAKDPQVDDKYICDIDTELCLKDLGKMEGQVLEIGCGVGRLMQDGYWGIDISNKMLDIAKKRKPLCNFIHNMNGYIPLTDSIFDNVYCYLVIQHLKPQEVQSYLNEAYRVLKHDGRILFQFIVGTEREPLSNHYSMAEMQTMLTEAGFTGIFTRPSVAHELWTMIGAYK